MQQAEADGSFLAIAAEQAPVFDLAVPDRLVHREAVAIEAAYRGDALAFEVAEHRGVELPNPAAVADDAERRRDHMVLGAWCQAGQDALYVVRGLEHEVGVNQAVDLSGGQ